jgi:hypothetical protein
MPTLERAELTERIARCLKTVRTAPAALSRHLALRTLMRLEAELAETDRQAAGPNAAHHFAALPSGHALRNDP